MDLQEIEMGEVFVQPPDEAAMLEANVNPKTGLATDFLNLFNEYIMLAQLVADGSMDWDVLGDWMPVDYETHFIVSGFSGSDVVLASYRTLPENVRKEFEQTVNILTILIVDHQVAEIVDFTQMEAIMHQRDQLSMLISDPVHHTPVDTDDTQAAIDAMFD